jgi:hypothetical protein
MSESMSTGQAQSSVLVIIGNKLAQELKVLLEAKHLYQKVEYQPWETVKPLYERVYSTQKDDFTRWLNDTLPGIEILLEPYLTDRAKLIS